MRPDGKAVPQLLMPFSGMSDADIVAILSFLRAQPAVRHVVPADHFTLVGKVVKSFAPVFKPRDVALAPPTPPAAAATRERGEYLARSVGNCGGCHTPHNPVTFAATAPEFSGGEEMSPAARSGADRAVWFRTPNLTPAAGSALNKFPDRATFVARFQRGGRQSRGVADAVGGVREDERRGSRRALRILPRAAGAGGAGRRPAVQEGRLATCPAMQTALAYSRVMRAMFEIGISFGQTASHSPSFEQLPKPSASIWSTIATTRGVALDLALRQQRRGARSSRSMKRCADAFLHAATQAPQPMQAAESIASSDDVLAESGWRCRRARRRVLTET